MNLERINKMNHISALAKWKGVGSRRTADVKNHCGCGWKNSGKNLQRSKPFQLAIDARQTFGLSGPQIVGFNFFRDQPRLLAHCFCASTPISYSLCTRPPL